MVKSEFDLSILVNWPGYDSFERFASQNSDSQM